MKNLIHVVGAVIVKDGKILCAQRGPGKSLPYKWEFPGGKIEEGESHAAALEREIMEEFGCRIAVGDLVAETVYEYDFGELRESDMELRDSEGESRGSGDESRESDVESRETSVELRERVELREPGHESPVSGVELRERDIELRESDPELRETEPKPRVSTEESRESDAEPRVPSKAIHLTTYFCTIVEGEPTLTEHVAIRWLPKEELVNLDWAPADLPTVEKITRAPLR